jgi:hypothetical protein
MYTNEYSHNDKDDKLENEMEIPTIITSFKKIVGK